MHGRVYSEHIYGKRLILMLARYSIIKIEIIKLRQVMKIKLKKNISQ